jgi:hypothetical protein
MINRFGLIVLFAGIALTYIQVEVDAIKRSRCILYSGENGHYRRVRWLKEHPRKIGPINTCNFNLTGGIRSNIISTKVIDEKYLVSADYGDNLAVWSPADCSLVKSANISFTNGGAHILYVLPNNDILMAHQTDFAISLISYSDLSVLK